MKEEREDGVIPCLSEALLEANKVRSVIVLTVSRDGQIEASFSADYADQIALAMWLHVYMQERVRTGFEDRDEPEDAP